MGGIAGGLRAHCFQNSCFGIGADIFFSAVHTFRWLKLPKLVLTSNPYLWWSYFWDRQSMWHFQYLFHLKWQVKDFLLKFMILVLVLLISCAIISAVSDSCLLFKSLYFTYTCQLKMYLVFLKNCNY